MDKRESTYEELLHEFTNGPISINNPAFVKEPKPEEIKDYLNAIWKNHSCPVEYALKAVELLLKYY